MMKVLLTILLTFLLIPFSSKAQSYIYQEEFLKQGTWTKADNETRELYVANGKYYFEHKRAEDSWYISTRTFVIDFTRDFEIETSIQKISGIQNYAMSFLYDFKDEDNYNEFGISASGYYRVATMKDKSFSAIRSWTKSNELKEGNYKTNKLRIKKNGNKIKYYINDNYVYEVDFNKFIGNKIALKLTKNQKIAIDYIHIKYTGSSNSSSSGKTILFEGFNNDKNNWSESSDTDTDLSITNGDYIINRKIESGGITSTIKKEINTSRDFRITGQIKKVKGVKNNGFGLVFGREGSDNQNQFFISSDGSYIINKTVNGTRSYIKNWTASSHIKKGNGVYNYLKVQKVGNAYKFFINSNLVHTSYSTKFYGDRVGFVVYDIQKISVGYLSISYEDDKTSITPPTPTKKDPHTIKETILFDGYTSNDNEWSTSNTNERLLEVRDGRYYIDHKRASGGWSSTIVEEIDTSRDFKILAAFKKESGILNNGYGLTFNRLDSDNQNLFYINGNGSFTISKMRDSRHNYLKDWVKSSAIKKGNGAHNTLKVIKIGSKLEYYINDTKVYTDYSPNFPGDRLGYVVYNEQKISVAYISLGYLDKKTQKVIPTDNTSNGIYHFNDEFKSNLNEWTEINDTKKEFKIKNGKYYLSYKLNKKGWSTFSDTPIDTRKDFEIKTKINKISGVNNYGYGLVFGRESNNDYRFYIVANGLYKIAKKVNNREKIIKDWTNTSTINKGDSKSNTLKVKKENGYYKFYINDTIIYEMDFEPFFGNGLGFSVYNKQQVSVDYLTVKYLK